MNASARSRCVLCIGAAIALLAGCANGTGVSVGMPGSDVPNTLQYHRTFRYTGKAQSFKVPAHVTQLTISASGASGAPGNDFGDSKYAAAGGRGGRVQAVIPVTAGEGLIIFVGGSGAVSGFNGGGAGGGTGGAVAVAEVRRVYGKVVIV